MKRKIVMQRSRYFSLLLFLIGFISCDNATRMNPENQDNVDPLTQLIQKGRTAAEATTADYKKLPEMINYLPPEVTGIEDIYQNIQKQNAFLDQAIPAEGSKRLQWEQGMTWQKADHIYSAFVTAQAGHQFINVFRTLGAYEILVRLDLLGDTTQLAHQKVNYYLHELIKGKSINTPLIEYCMKTLAKEGYPADQLKADAKQVIENINNSDKFEYLQSFAQNPPSYHPKTDNPAFDSLRMVDAKESIRHAKETYARLLTAKQKIGEYISPTRDE